MSHATYTWGNWGDFWLLMLGSQTVNLTLDLSVGHNLCFKCPNGWCEPILDIYISIAFQWYKKLFKPMGFDPLQSHSEDSRVHLGLQLPQWEFTWECEGSFPHILCTHGRRWCDSRASLLARNLASPCLGHQPKVRVATWLMWLE
jgi:hypothetical protein